MDTITQLRQTIQSLDCANPVTVERAKREMLTLVVSFANFASVGRQPETLHERLSRREQEVMSMMLAGKRLKEIAAELDISVKTVTTHRSRLLRKLRIDDNLGLYRYGVRNGLIEL